MRCSGSFTPSPSSRHVRLASQRGKVIGNAGGCFKRLARAGIWCVFGSTIIVFTQNMTARVQVSWALHCTCTPAAPEGQGRCEHDTCTAAQRCPNVRIAADSGGGQCPRVIRRASRPAGCVATCPDRRTVTFGQNSKGSLHEYMGQKRDIYEKSAVFFRGTNADCTLRRTTWCQPAML